MHNREIIRIVKRDYIKSSIECMDQMFFLLSFKRNLCKIKKKSKS